MTEFRNPSALALPGNQSQVIVLEDADDDKKSINVSSLILVREASINATSSGDLLVYQNLFIQPIDRVCVWITRIISILMEYPGASDSKDIKFPKSDQALTRESKPSNLLDTLALSGLAIAANLEAISFLDILSSLNLNDSFSTCHACTFLVPVNHTFASANISAFSSTQISTILSNHVRHTHQIPLAVKTPEGDS